MPWSKTADKQWGYWGRVDWRVAYTPRMYIRHYLINGVSFVSWTSPRGSTYLISREIPVPVQWPFPYLGISELMSCSFKPTTKVVDEGMECRLREVRIHPDSAKDSDVSCGGADDQAFYTF